MDPSIDTGFGKKLFGMIFFPLSMLCGIGCGCGYSQLDGGGNANLGITLLIY